MLGATAVGCGDGLDGGDQLAGVDVADLPPAIEDEVARQPDRAAQEQVVRAWQARRAEISAFHAQRTRGWDVIATRQSQTGQIFDYVRADTLYPDDPAAPFAQPPPALPSTTPNGVRKGLTEFDTDPSLRAPEGTIAVARPRFDAYELGEIRARDLGEFMDVAWPKPAPAFVNNRLYGTHRDSRANIGTRGFINLWDYQQVASNEMSLLQEAALCWGASSATTLEAIEVGFQKLQSLYGDTAIHVFTYFRTAGGASGDRVGGYNLNVKGFIQAAGAFPPGAAMGSPLSVIDGAQTECEVQVQLFQNRWWVNVCGTWIGYYPTQFAADAAGNRITFDLIGTGTCEIHWYGEIFDAVPSVWTNADMASGRFASEGFARAGYIREPILLHNGSSSWFSSAVPGTGNGYDPDCYTVSALFQNGGAGWGNWFYIGGPGGNNPGCN